MNDNKELIEFVFGVVMFYSFGLWAIPMILFYLYLQSK